MGHFIKSLLFATASDHHHTIYYKMSTSERPNIEGLDNNTVANRSAGTYTLSKLERDPLVGVGGLGAIGCLIYMFRMRRKGLSKASLSNHIIYTRLMFCGCMVTAMLGTKIQHWWEKKSTSK